MIKNYFGSRRGKSHIKNAIVCQDYSKTVVISNELTVAVIADGVGQAKLAERGSKAAVEAVCDYCMSVLKNTKLNDSKILDTLKDAYASAYNAIIDLSTSENNPMYDYDTTLDTVAFFNGKVIYGHSGDGGIIALRNNGLYELITKPQNGSDGISVIPLRFNKAWEFGICSGKYASVLLATDGVYNTIVYTKYKDPNRYIFTRLLEPMMNLSQTNLDNKALEAQREKMLDFLFNDSIISDDITVSVVYDEKAKVESQPDDYYAVPNWSEINREKREAIFGKSSPAPTTIQAHEPKRIRFGRKKPNDFKLSGKMLKRKR